MIENRQTTERTSRNNIIPRVLGCTVSPWYLLKRRTTFLTVVVCTRHFFSSRPCANRRESGSGAGEPSPQYFPSTTAHTARYGHPLSICKLFSLRCWVSHILVFLPLSRASSGRQMHSPVATIPPSPALPAAVKKRKDTRVNLSVGQTAKQLAPGPPDRNLTHYFSSSSQLGKVTKK